MTIGNRAGIGPGLVVAVVGASGVGKDSIIDYARGRLDADVVRRVITRPPGPGEQHLSVTPEEFDDACARGEFALSWDAHGLRYGIPVTVDRSVRAGMTVIVNVSRGVLEAIRDRYARVLVIKVTVSDETRRRRLEGRGRESAADVMSRLARPDPAPVFDDAVEIGNDGSLADAGEAFVRAVRAVAVGAVGDAPVEAGPPR